MAFCNNDARCGHGCGRQDDHGGACDCYQKDCKLSNHFVYEEKQPIQLTRVVRPSWDEIWMRFAEDLARRSTCRRLSVGCVIVSDDNSIVLGMGYNGGPKGLNNDCLSDEPGKCGHLHAEINALIKTNYRDASPKKAYITTEPCYGCSVALVNANIREVVYSHEYRSHDGVALLRKKGIPVRKFPQEGVPERYLQVDKDRQP